MARRVAGQRHRRRGRHLPAGLRRAGDGCGIDPQKQQRHARFFGRERKATAGGQVQLAHWSPAFHHHGVQGRVAQALHRRAQQRHGIGKHADKRLARPAAQIAPSFGLKHAPQPSRSTRTQPQHATRLAGKTRRQTHGKPANRACVLRLRGIDLMQPRACRPADQSLQHGQTEPAGKRLQLLCAVADRKGNDSHVPIMF